VRAAPSPRNRGEFSEEANAPAIKRQLDVSGATAMKVLK
jgi:hypothetical protein